jgi:hypothetical protein
MAEGQEAPVLAFVVHALEPIPALDTFVESDWRIRRERVGEVDAIRVTAGPEDANGQIDAHRARGYWFDTDGRLVNAVFSNLEMRRSDFQDYRGTQICHRILVYKDEKLGMEIRVLDVSPATKVTGDIFEVRGHKWTRAFTDEVR